MPPDIADPPHIVGPKPVVFPTAVAALDLIEWDHVATQGRDHYVRIVYEGFLYPFGHRASLVKVTERKVEAPQGTEGNPDESPVAYLRQRMYIIVREHTKDYSGAPFQYFGREMPFQDQVTIKTKVTPEIDPPTWIGDSSFRVDVDGTTFPFALVGRDAAGADVNFLAPLIFVSLAETQLGVVQSTYAGDNTLRRCSVKGRDIAYADPSAGDTTMKTSSLYFNAEITNAAPPYPTAPFLPSLDSAAVTVPALSALLGQNTAVLVALYSQYLSDGLDTNAGVFAQVVGTPPPVAFSADKSGGFARPNLALTALSARKGLVSGDPNDAAAGVIDPAAYFGDIDAKLFGTIDLGQLIPLEALTHRADAAVNAPEIRTRAIPNRRHPDAAQHDHRLEAAVAGLPAGRIAGEHHLQRRRPVRVAPARPARGTPRRHAASVASPWHADPLRPAAVRRHRAEDRRPHLQLGERCQVDGRATASPRRTRSASRARLRSSRPWPTSCRRGCSAGPAHRSS